MGLLMWLRDPGRRGVLIGQIYGDDAELALEAVDELWVRGWLTDAGRWQLWRPLPGA